MSETPAAVETVVDAVADEPPERRVSLAGQGADALLADVVGEDLPRDDPRCGAAAEHVRLTVQESALFGSPTFSIEAGGALETGELERLNADRRESIEAGTDDLASGRAKRHEIAQDIPRYLD